MARPAPYKAAAGLIDTRAEYLYLRVSFIYSHARGHIFGDKRKQVDFPDAGESPSPAVRDVDFLSRSSPYRVTQLIALRWRIGRFFSVVEFQTRKNTWFSLERFLKKR